MRKAEDFKGDLKKFLQSYDYPQPELTEYLDNIKNSDFDQALLNEIVLWKVNRYVKIADNLLNEINFLKELSNGEHRKGGILLEKILDLKGVDLAMASTILRFRNPEVFQIIDRHAYRAIYGEKYPLNRSTNVKKKIDVYFKYLERLIELCKVKNLEFCTIDRLLYQFDKETNGKL